MPREPPPQVIINPNHGGIIYEVNHNDVLSGHSHAARFHPGNVALKTHVAAGYFEEYEYADKKEKAHVAARLVEEIRGMVPRGRFLKECGVEDDGRVRYVEIGDQKAWLKAAQALRDVDNNRVITLPPVKRNKNTTTVRKIGGPSNNNAPQSVQQSNRALRKNGSSSKNKSSNCLPNIESSKKNNKNNSSNRNSNRNRNSSNNNTFTGTDLSRKNDSNSSSSNNDNNNHNNNDSSSSCSSNNRDKNLPRTDSSKISTNFSSAASSPHDRGRLVILPPSSNDTSLSHQRDTAEDCGRQWPLYEQHCRTYGFAVEVEQLLTTTTPSLHRGENSRNSIDALGAGGPRTNFLLIDNDNKNKTSKVKPLQRISERLVIRPCIHDEASTMTNLHPKLREGDVIQTLDGRPDPTFAVLYAMMCRKEKLVLEVVCGRNHRANSTNVVSGEGVPANVAHDVVGREGVAAKVATAHNELSARTKRVASTSSGSNAAEASNESNSNENNGRKSYTRDESFTRPSKRPSRWGAKTRVTPSEMIDLILEESGQKSSPLILMDQGSPSSSKTPPNEQEKQTGLSNHQREGGTKNVLSTKEPRLSKNADTRGGEVALFNVVDQHLNQEMVKDHHQKEQDEIMPARSKVETAATSVYSATTTTTNHSGDKVNISSSSTPTTFRWAKYDDDPISLSSSSSVSSSSSDSDSSSSSDSDSDSDSSTSSSSRKPRSLPCKHPIQSLQNETAQSSTSLFRPIDALPYQRVQNRHMFQASSQKSLASNLPSLQASQKRLTPTQYISTTPSTSNNINEAPTSLNRLWPDPSDIIKALAKWQPPIAAVRIDYQNKQTVEFHGPIQCHYNGSENEQNNPLLRHTLAGGSRDVPKEYKNASEIMEAMAHPLMNEGLCSINGDYHAEKDGSGRWNRDLYNLRLKKLTEVEPIFRTKSYFCGNIKMYEAQFSAHGETNLPPSNLCELYCMHFPDWEDCKFGIVAHDFPTTITFRKYNEGKAFLKLWLVVHPNEQDTKQTGWLSQKEFKKLLDPHKNGLAVKENATFTLISCGSTTNIVRQFEAIKCLPYLKPHLQKALFTSYTTDSSKPASTSAKPRSLPIDIWKALTTRHNSHQLSSISQVLTGSCRDNVCLLHGPPGTGKSSTIVGLVSALLSGKAPLPNQRQSGCLIHPGKTMGATYAEPQARNRILVCAATNQAVDSLAWKIKQGSIGPSGKVGDFVISRFGSLPWDLSRDSTDQKPKTLSEIEDFLYEINVDRRASDEMQDFEYDHDPQEEDMCWSTAKRKPKRRKRRKIVGRSKLRSQILGGSSVVVATLSGSGSKAFIDAVCRDPTRNDSEFDAVIIDEACQASEPESLIPFKFNPTTITLVGDPKQLPVLTLSGTSPNSKLFERSLFERLQSLNFPTILLRRQYRMHENIASFPSEQFYQGKLITPASVKDRLKPSWYCPCFPPLFFWDINGRNMTANPMGHGFMNKEEADFITHTLLSTLAHTFLKKSDVEVTVGIVSFYRDQVKLLREQLERIPALNNSRLKVKVATVDGFQGSECDIIILSCVRSHSQSTRDGQRRGNSIGFLNDNRRLNVALTRAKCSLWIVGNAEVLEASELWRKLIRHMSNERVLRRRDEFWDMFARWKASKE